MLKMMEEQGENESENEEEEEESIDNKGRKRDKSTYCLCTVICRE